MRFGGLRHQDRAMPRVNRVNPLQMTIRVTPQEQQVLKATAEARQISVASLIRRSLVRDGVPLPPRASEPSP